MSCDVNLFNMDVNKVRSNHVPFGVAHFRYSNILDISRVKTTTYGENFYKTARGIKQFSALNTMKKAENGHRTNPSKGDIRCRSSVIRLNDALRMVEIEIYKPPEKNDIHHPTYESYQYLYRVHQEGMGINKQSAAKNNLFFPFVRQTTYKKYDLGIIYSEFSRVNTFYGNMWPAQRGIPYPKYLAAAGFYYRGNQLEVHCFDCKLKTNVTTWEEGERPDQAHARLNPECNYVLANYFQKMPPRPQQKSKEDFTREHNEQNNIPMEKDDTSSVQNFNLNFNTQDGINIKESPNSRKYQRHQIGTEIENMTLKEDFPSSVQNGLQIDTLRHLNGSLDASQIVTTDAMNSQIWTDGIQSFHPEFKYPQYQATTARLRSYDKWKYAHKQSAESLSEAGYFYTGENDIVRCFCCDLGLAEWDPKDVPWVEHARHNPKCWFLKTEKGDLFIDDIQKDWKRIYNPKHAAYDDKLSRIATFEGWREDIEQTPEILVDAGFFFTGEEDIVRCHYCDGGLRHWEPGDSPWEEHARWFPFCKYLIKMKGRDYIEEIKKRTEERQRSENGYFTTSSVQVFQELKDFGIDDPKINFAVEEYRKRKGNVDFTTAELLEIIFDDGKQKTQQKTNPFLAANNTMDDKTEEDDPQKILETNKKLKEKMKCVRCRTNDICMLFVNCGHRITCENCADNMDFCPICDTRIKKRIKTYLS